MSTQLAYTFTEVQDEKVAGDNIGRDNDVNCRKTAIIPIELHGEGESSDEAEEKSKIEGASQNENDTRVGRYVSSRLLRRHRSPRFLIDAEKSTEKETTIGNIWKSSLDDIRKPFSLVKDAEERRCPVPTMCIKNSKMSSQRRISRFVDEVAASDASIEAAFGKGLMSYEQYKKIKQVNQQQTLNSAKNA